MTIYHQSSLSDLTPVNLQLKRKIRTMANDRQRQRLREAMRQKQLIRFKRSLEHGSVHGYVLDVGTDFFLLLLVSDRIRFSGFQCFRVSDVRNLTPDPYTEFAEAALKKRGERKPQKPLVSVTNLGRLLLSANRAFPLVTIHREKLEPAVCHIGRVASIRNGCLLLLEIGPDAKWDKSVSQYRLKEITRVDFGGEYENALHLVGGDPTLELFLPPAGRLVTCDMAIFHQSSLSAKGPTRSN